MNETPTTSALRRRRAALLRQIPSLGAILKGSLIERYKRCGKQGCKCAQGAGHGPKYYLSLSRTGERPLMEYVPNDFHDDVVTLLENHKKLRQIIDEICEINFEILRRRERLD